MKKNEIKVGGKYLAKVNDRVVSVRVDSIREITVGKTTSTRYDVTNLSTGRKTSFRSATKFRREVAEVPAENRREVFPADETEHLDLTRETPRPFVGAEELESTPTTQPDKPTADTAAVAVSSLSASIASAVNGTAKVAGYTPTAEQAAVLDAARRSPKVLVIKAGAGAGKTSTLKMLEQVMAGRGQYTAFNSSLVAESKKKFVRAACNTTHSLAFRTVGRKYAHRLGGARVKSEVVARVLGIEPMTVEGFNKVDGMPTTRVLTPSFLAGQVLVACRRFCQSDAREIGKEHFKYIDGLDFPVDGKRTYEKNEAVREYLLPFAKKAWADMNDPDGCLPYNPDCYVKTWQLGTGDDKPVIAADYILTDEAQDLAPVFLDVLRRQDHAILIFVGDSNQSIYEWRGAIDAMKAFPDAASGMLSQSFRFGQAVADVANSILATLEDPTDLVMRGLESIPSRVTTVAAPRCILCRTNAGAVATVLRYVGEGKQPHLIGGGSEVVAFVKAAKDLQDGRRTNHPELGCFESWKEVEEYAKTDEGDDLKLMVKLIKEFGCEAILSALERMPDEKHADVVVSTAHKSKGREWESVKLHADFPPAYKLDDAGRRLLYVAATRAQHELDISECPTFTGGVNEDGAPYPGIEVRYTTAMPTAEALAAYVTSKKSPVKTEDKVESTPAPVDTPTPAPAASGSKPVFTWASNGGEWFVRGPAGHEDSEVTVTKKDGKWNSVRVGKAHKKFADAWLYRKA